MDKNKGLPRDPANQRIIDDHKATLAALKRLEERERRERERREEEERCEEEERREEKERREQEELASDAKDDEPQDTEREPRDERAERARRSEKRKKQPKKLLARRGGANLRPEDQATRKDLMSTIIVENPDVEWDDIAGLEPAKASLKQSFILPIKHPQLFKDKRKPDRCVLLYGPPGTGKTYLAKAVATESQDCTFFSISSSALIRPLLGQSEKCVQLLFDLARESKPSIIFVDEFDAMCGRREEKGGEYKLSMKTEFMTQLDGLGNNNDGVGIIAATNMPWALDSSIRRRCQKKIYVPLPDQDARARMFQIHVETQSPSLTPILTSVHYNYFAEKSEGYSGDDIQNVVSDALNRPIKRIGSAKYWKKIQHNGVEKWTPCSREYARAVRMSAEDIDPEQLFESPVGTEDFLEALEESKRSVGQDELERFDEWTKEYGQRGA